MKRVFFYFIFLLFSLTLFGNDRLLLGLHGIQPKDDAYYKLSGYSITVSSFKSKDKKDTEKTLRKKYGLKSITSEYTDTQVRTANLVIEGYYEPENSENEKVTQIYYLFPKENSQKTDVVIFETRMKRDQYIEQKILDLYQNKSLSDYLEKDCCIANSVNFVGRTIYLGDACRWMGPNNLYHQGGQISWSEFRTMEEAKEDNTLYIEHGRGMNGVILQDEEIDIFFEGIPTVARRIVYRSVSKQSSWFPRTTSLPLVVYYVVQEVRGRYVSCVLSNYGYNKKDYYLSPLLEQVMEIITMPSDAYWKFNVPQPDELNKEEVDKINNIKSNTYTPYFFNFMTGAYFPIGNLNKSLNAGPFFGLKLGTGDEKGYRFDLSFCVAAPLYSPQFNYYRKGETYSTKANSVFSIGLSMGHEKKINRNFYWEKYVGINYGGITTDIRRDENDKSKGYRQIGTIAINGGLSIRYKKVGCFVEYDYAPYSMGGKVRNGFGNSAIVTGLNFKF